jgi:hypothetical protein
MFINTVLKLFTVNADLNFDPHNWEVDTHRKFSVSFCILLALAAGIA